jgi:hypothetical protein
MLCARHCGSDKGTNQMSIVKIAINQITLDVQWPLTEKGGILRSRPVCGYQATIDGNFLTIHNLQGHVIYTNKYTSCNRKVAMKQASQALEQILNGEII